LKFGNEVFRKGDEEDNVSEIKNKEIIGWDSFKKRMVVLNESETSDKNVEELDIVNRNRIQYAKVCLDWNNLGSRQYVYISSSCLKNYIDPYSYLQALKKGATPDKDYSLLASSLTSLLYERVDMKLVFCIGDALLTWK